MRLRWTKPALADLQNIHAYVANDDSRAATAVLGAIRKTIRGQLMFSPFAGRRGRVDDTYELVVPRTPFIVAYRITDTEILILRVLHSAQQWPKKV